jgi:hypothetical protein
MAGSIVLLPVLLAALGTNGWLLPAWSAALATATWGISTLSDSGSSAAGSYEPVWGWCALAWAAAVAGVAQLELRRERQTLEERPPNRPLEAR